MATEREYGLEVAQSFMYPYEADLAKTLLESRGISAWILDETQIRMRWHLSAALGGVKVAVLPDDVVEARRLLASDFSADLAEIPESALEPDPVEVCPSCGRGVVTPVESRTRVSFRTVFGLVFSWIGGVLFPIRRVRESRRCSQCGDSWESQSVR